MLASRLHRAITLLADDIIKNYAATSSPRASSLSSWQVPIILVIDFVIMIAYVATTFIIMVSCPMPQRRVPSFILMNTSAKLTECSRHGAHTFRAITGRNSQSTEAMRVWVRHWMRYRRESMRASSASFFCIIAILELISTAHWSRTNSHCAPYLHRWRKLTLRWTNSLRLICVISNSCWLAFL